MNRCKRFFAIVTLAANYALIIGGRQQDWSLSNETEKLDVYADEWTKLPAMKVGRECHAACVLAGAVYTFCGYDSKGTALNSIEKLPINE